MFCCKSWMDLFTFLFFSGKQTRTVMANITEAEKIAHYWAKQTATAISWTGGLTFLVALAALIFNVWVHFSDNDKEEKRRRRADALDRERCRKNDVIDEERRQRRDEEDMETRRRKERGG